MAMSMCSWARLLYSGMLTANGASVPRRTSRTAASRASGYIGPAAMTPSPPARETASASAALDEAQLMPPWMMG
ncbi:hypothetical protein G6F50_018739 [Rhizopus delemar]|uniref:Uncharacterized protein n=1 Tax=Rhizopus delemar TaxID=936053 RepID=A0A9P6XKZ8_9FUNG|nr:hypothetical protein G6F50_018739 [Rhizopus delemar]